MLGLERTASRVTWKEMWTHLSNIVVPLTGLSLFLYKSMYACKRDNTDL